MTVWVHMGMANKVGKLEEKRRLFPQRCILCYPKRMTTPYFDPAKNGNLLDCYYDYLYAAAVVRNGGEAGGALEVLEEETRRSPLHKAKLGFCIARMRP